MLWKCEVANWGTAFVLADNIETATKRAAAWAAVNSTSDAKKYPPTKAQYAKAIEHGRVVTSVTLVTRSEIVGEIEV